MKTKILLALLSLTAASAAATDALQISSKSGEVVTYAFAQRPVVTYRDDIMVIATPQTTMEYPLADLLGLTFVETTDAIEQVTLSPGTDATSAVVVYNLAGQVVARYDVALGGRASFSTQSLDAGTYVVKNGNVTYKIIKK